MDFGMKQWRINDSPEAAQQDDEEHNPETTKLLNTHPSSALPLFLPHQNSKSRISGMRGYFSFSQWQELELQALIFRHMAAGAPVPQDLLYLINTTVSPYHHSACAGLQSGCWGRAAVVDPEPGRCRRTDGKKWRCSRDVVAGQKYCERHVHRGRNRSRKTVEPPHAANSSVKSGHSMDLLNFNRRAFETSVGPFEAQNDVRPNSGMLRHFFNDWPKAVDDSGSGIDLSISMHGNQPSSDFSLRLGTGHGEETASVNAKDDDKPRLNWMGGPLAEALKLASASSSSPTSVLHPLPLSRRELY